MTRGNSQITGLLKGWAAGDEAALEALIPVVYKELRRAAARYMKGERTGHTLQPTALVNEVYLRLVNLHDVSWHDRTHFFAVAAQLMRRILVDAARARASVKRGGRAQRAEHSSPFDFDQLPDAASIQDRELVNIDEALRRLSEVDARKAKVIEMRFFGGLSVDETAAALKVSPQTVMRDWKLARAWMLRELNTR